MVTGSWSTASSPSHFLKAVPRPTSTISTAHSCAPSFPVTQYIVSFKAIPVVRDTNMDTRVYTQRKRKKERRRQVYVFVRCNWPVSKKHKLRRAATADLSISFFFPFFSRFVALCNRNAKPASCNESKCAGEDIELARYIVHGLSPPVAFLTAGQILW